jgi:predicted DNA-binding transcriptional regulator YafY
MNIMGKKRNTTATTSTANVTAERAGRLYQLLKLLGQRPQTRNALCERLRLTVRGFYRDLEQLRGAGIGIELTEAAYSLRGTVAQALDRLPFHADPPLTLGEAMQLARGRTAAHRKLKAQITAITGGRP